MRVAPLLGGEERQRNLVSFVYEEFSCVCISSPSPSSPRRGVKRGIIYLAMDPAATALMAAQSKPFNVN
jgi:hypothetical protein